MDLSLDDERVDDVAEIVDRGPAVDGDDARRRIDLELAEASREAKLCASSITKSRLFSALPFFCKANAFDIAVDIRCLVSSETSLMMICSRVSPSINGVTSSLGSIT